MDSTIRLEHFLTVSDNKTAVAERLRVYVSGLGKIEAWGSNPAWYSNAGLEPPPSPVNVDSERTIYGRTLRTRSGPWDTHGNPRIALVEVRP